MVVERGRTEEYPEEKVDEEGNGRTQESRQGYKEMRCKVKREVAKAKQEEYDEPQDGLDSKE